MAGMTRRQALASALGAASALVLGPRGMAFATVEPAAAPPPPPNRTGNGIRDRTRYKEFQAPVPIAGAARNTPVPGGVGCGVFYTPEFHMDWGTGTSLAFDIVCPNPHGGNFDDYLFITATNRSALGAEALVVYYPRDEFEPYFWVFDWARVSDPWQSGIPFSLLGDYLSSANAPANAPHVLPVWNSTWNIGGSAYRNEIRLYNHALHSWDRVYQHDYLATDTQQKSGGGGWGPIVETFQPEYSQTRPMGATGTLVSSADEAGQWGRWAPLSAKESSFVRPSFGFRLRFVAPNFAFVVVS